eukprot:TRINITY_DN70767_c0_g1_i1.p1 TRINITY_DN70767_c0_g1~~TRINITY_DN70767_c0_g1_i1.p1  ORF type:complete len:557 (+),score=106.57 TRINITY_DN70767_c0_g1_i1:96-1766(+)
MSKDVAPAKPPEGRGVDLINEYGREQFDGVLTCHWTEAKGRILRANKVFKPGEVILIERPTHRVQMEKQSRAFQKLEKLCADNPDKCDYEPLWYWCALRSLTAPEISDAREGGWTPVAKEVQDRLLLLHHMDHSVESSPGSSSQLLAKELAPSAAPAVIEALTQIWVLNCFDWTDDPPGYITYFFSSFMSHSCHPNAFWHYSDDDHVLRARRHISIGDEVCISYLDEEFLFQSVPVRRWDLRETKHFWCDCPRCTGEADDSRGFVCNNCREGSIFAPGPGVGPSEIEGESPPELDMVGRVCSKCKHEVTKEQGEQYQRYERALKTLVDDLRERANSKSKAVTINEAAEIEAFVDSVFSQHILADTAWNLLGELFESQNRYGDQCRVLSRSVDFHKNAFEGLNAGHAWSLEAYGDALRTTARLQKNGTAGSQIKGEVPMAPRVAVAKAKECWLKALEILRLLHGGDHEYVKNLESKLRQLPALETLSNEQAEDTVANAWKMAKEVAAQQKLRQREEGSLSPSAAAKSAASAESSTLPVGKRRRVSEKRPSETIAPTE